MASERTYTVCVRIIYATGVQASDKSAYSNRAFCGRAFIDFDINTLAAVNNVLPDSWSVISAICARVTVMTVPM